MSTYKNKIEKLLSELCPNGVPMKKMSEVGTFTRGRRFVKDDIRSEGVPCIHYGEMYTHYGIWANKAKSFLDKGLALRLRSAKPNDVIIVAAGETIEDIGNGVAWLGGTDVVIHDACFIFSHSLNSKYISYFLQTDAFHSQIKRYISSGKISSINADGLEKAIIPVPPIEIQQEIVRILDSFTELEAELEARKKQYYYYRSSLFKFDDDINWTTLDKISENLDSKRKPVTKGNRDKGEIPYYGASGIVDHVSSYIFDGDYLLISEDGANLLARSTPIAFSISGKTWVNNHAHVLKFDTYVTRRFVEIYLNSIDLSAYISGAAQPKLNKANMNKILIPFPKINEQERVVRILDKFEALNTDISIGLPAELKARRSQYEYYRSKLLTFNEYVS